MEKLWSDYWKQVLVGLTIAAVVGMGTGLVVAFKIYYQVQEIQQEVNQLDWIRERQAAHEVALIHLSDHAGYDLERLLEILDSSPRDADVEDGDKNKLYE